MTTNRKDHWQIYVITDTQQSVVVTINKNESVAKLFEKFREKYPAIQKKTRFSFMTADGVELQEDDGRRLVDVRCLRDMCNIQLIVHTDGGLWPNEAEVRQRLRDPTQVPTLARRITTTIPDILGMYDETPRVKMCCGHAIAPASLALHCFYELQNGSDSITCPDRGCNTVWPYTSIVDAACLSQNEANQFERKMILNRLRNPLSEIKGCPGCGNCFRRSNNVGKRIRCSKCTLDRGDKSFEFCWLCLKQWRNKDGYALCGNLKCNDYTIHVECLANCRLKTLCGIQCPSIRSCPKCFMLIEHTQNCKKMTCPNRSCKYEFCFICLKSFPCKTGAYEPCELAPRQNISSNNSCRPDLPAIHYSHFHPRPPDSGSPACPPISQYYRFHPRSSSPSSWSLCVNTGDLSTASPSHSPPPYHPRSSSPSSWSLCVNTGNRRAAYSAFSRRPQSRSSRWHLGTPSGKLWT